MRIKPPFKFKQFSIAHDRCAHKVGTDGVLLGAWAESNHPKRILDVGSGSGLIALMLAQRFPMARVTGIEMHSPSARQASENAAASPFADRIDIIEGDFLKQPFECTFDLIVSNPPFFKAGYHSGKDERDRARQEEFLPQRPFLNKVEELLNPSGHLAVILPRAEARDFITQTLTLTRPLHLQKLLKIKGSPTAADKRWLLQLGFEKGDASTAYFRLREENGQYSEQYRELTREFHPDF